MEVVVVVCCRWEKWMPGRAGGWAGKKRADGCTKVRARASLLAWVRRNVPFSWHLNKPVCRTRQGPSGRGRISGRRERKCAVNPAATTPASRAASLAGRHRHFCRCGGVLARSGPGPGGQVADTPRFSGGGYSGQALNPGLGATHPIETTTTTTPTTTYLLIEQYELW